ncbi:MAG: protease complex subunit PrcB family protein [Opitutus sp.]|nr:protease complex subunit PrcB family protein [Opitutus sp.]
MIHSEEEWVQLWRDIGREPPRAWGRGEESAVGIFLGQRRSGGFAIEVLGVDRDGSVVRVSYREKTPSGGVVAQVLTSPWAVVAVPVASAEVQVVAQSSPRSPIQRQQK